MPPQSPALQSPHTHTRTHATRWRLCIVFIPGIARVRAAVKLRSVAHGIARQTALRCGSMWYCFNMIRGRGARSRFPCRACLCICPTMIRPRQGFVFTPRLVAGVNFLRGACFWSVCVFQVCVCVRRFHSVMDFFSPSFLGVRGVGGGLSQSWCQNVNHASLLI